MAKKKIPDLVWALFVFIGVILLLIAVKNIFHLT